MRDTIISEIQRLAKQNGQAPGQMLFTSETGIIPSAWRGKYWARWGDALIEAGYQPNEWGSRLDSAEVLAGILVACRHYGHLPTRDEFAIYRRSEPRIPSEQAIRRHFGHRSDLIAAVAQHVSGKPEYADISAMLPAVVSGSTRTQKTVKSKEGHVYLIQSGDFYKIGRSDEIERRIKEIRVALPDKAILIHGILTDDPPGIEAYWHRRFADKRANGEWFRLLPADVAAFRRRKFQ